MPVVLDERGLVAVLDVQHRVRVRRGPQEAEGEPAEVAGALPQGVRPRAEDNAEPDRHPEAPPGTPARGTPPPAADTARRPAPRTRTAQSEPPAPPVKRQAAPPG